MEIGRSIFPGAQRRAQDPLKFRFSVGATPWLGRSFRRKPGLRLGDYGLPLMIAFQPFGRSVHDHDTT